MRASPLCRALRCCSMRRCSRPARARKSNEETRIATTDEAARQQGGTDQAGRRAQHAAPRRAAFARSELAHSISSEARLRLVRKPLPDLREPSPYHDPPAKSYLRGRRGAASCNPDRLRHSARGRYGNYANFSFDSCPRSELVRHANARSGFAIHAWSGRRDGLPVHSLAFHRQRIS